MVDPALGMDCSGLRALTMRGSVANVGVLLRFASLGCANALGIVKSELQFREYQALCGPATDFVRTFQLSCVLGITGWGVIGVRRGWGWTGFVVR